MTDRPPFVVHWKDHLVPDENVAKATGERFAYGADLSKATGLERIGVWADIVGPGRRTSLPHAHEKIEEIVFVLEGALDVWVDGHLHALKQGDVAGFPQGTGIAHTFMNNGKADARLLVVGDRTQDDRVFYPVNPERNAFMRERGWEWDHMPARPLGDHDGKPGSKGGKGADVPGFILHWKDHIGADENHYPGSDEPLCYGAEFTSILGLKRIGAGIDIIPPGRRSGWPHAHEEEEEFVYILTGTPDLWIDGHIYPLKPGDAAGFPAGTGIAHTFINNSDTDVLYVVLGEREKYLTRITYPLHPARNQEIGERHWTAAPHRERGPHDGKPDALRGNGG